ncbi:MAG: NAD-dependent protein deacylase [Clostridiales bacterium]|nr:NAD-dependent protein deacylase [Clostridiales bacterium]
MKTPEPEIAKLKEWIDSARAIVFFGGAGVSTESGIPDFRSESGLYKARQEYGYSPEQIISHSFFLRDPETFYRYYKENLIYPNARPNAAHLGIAALEREAGKDVCVVTQNIDGLHQAAGSSRVYELHGSVHRNYCLDCGARYDLAYILNSPGPVPRCARCGGMVRPDVVLYEEGLDGGVVNGAVNAITDAGLLIVGGTSLVVYPAAGFLNYYRGKHLVLINLTETGADSRAGLVIRKPIGEVFSALELSRPKQ